MLLQRIVNVVPLKGEKNATNHRSADPNFSPRQYPTGVDYVIVNGVVVLTPRGLTGSRPGHAVLHRAGSR